MVRRAADSGVEQLRPVVISIYIEELMARRSAPSVKQHLAAIRMLFRLAGDRPGGAHEPAASVRAQST